MRWQSFEDKICCAIFIKNHVISSMSIELSIKEAIKKGVDKAEGSIKMKFSDIAAICDNLGIKVSTKMGRLTNYSKQNYLEFQDVLRVLNLDVGRQ